MTNTATFIVPADEARGRAAQELLLRQVTPDDIAGPRGAFKPLASLMANATNNPAPFGSEQNVLKWVCHPNRVAYCAYDEGQRPVMWVQGAYTESAFHKKMQPVLACEDDAVPRNKITLVAVVNPDGGGGGLARPCLKATIGLIPEDAPDVTGYATLSPGTGYRDWITKADAALLERSGAGDLLDMGSEQFSRFRTTVNASGSIGDLKEAGVYEDLCRLFSLHVTGGELVAARGPTAEKLVFKHYNPVARLHLENEAIVFDICPEGDESEIGFKNSYGILVNYGYAMREVGTGMPPRSPRVDEWLIPKPNAHMTSRL